jgi:pimeloyl-ACP methyl ester carboxylesterase
MLVGFSQGGMDAQNLATELDVNDGWNESMRSKVTTVITFGSPTIASKPSNVAELHVQDTGDHVPGLVLIPPVPVPHPPFYDDLVQDATGRPSAYFYFERYLAQYIQQTLYIGTSGQPANDPSAAVNVVLGNHPNPDTYRVLADQVTYGTPGQFTNVKDAITRFQGTLMPPGGGGNGVTA